MMLRGELKLCNKRNIYIRLVIDLPVDVRCYMLLECLNLCHFSYTIY